jgi:hypothetical protein
MNPPDPSAKPAAPSPGTAEPPVDQAHRPAPVDLSEESIAGEEDPGAALDDIPESPASPAPDRKP